MDAAARMSGGPGTADPAQITYRNIEMIRLLSLAYDTYRFQITGPEWLNEEIYDVSARLPPDTTREQFRLMLQNLLAERFHLVIRRETRDVPGYELRIDRRGSKLKEAGSGSPVPERFPQLDHPGIIMGMKMAPGGRIPSVYLTARAQRMTELVRMIGEDLERPVIDNTGLTGTYDYTLEYAPARGMPALPSPAADGAADESGPSIITAVQQQLGLKLIPEKVPLDMIIVQSGDEEPTEN